MNPLNRYVSATPLSLQRGIEAHVDQPPRLSGAQPHSGEANLRIAAQTEVTLAAVQAKPQDPCSLASRANVQVQAVAVGVPAWAVSANAGEAVDGA